MLDMMVEDGGMAQDYVRSRKDVAIVGSDGVMMRFGDESHFVPGDPDGRLVTALFAMGYEALGVTGDDGLPALFVVRPLVPFAYRQVCVGEEILPTPGMPSPAVASFPSACDLTNMTRDELARALRDDGVCDGDPGLRPVVLLVSLRTIGDVPYGERGWACRLASMSAGDLSSCLLNTEGRMAVKVVAKVRDVAGLSVDATMALEAYDRRMGILRGASWGAAAQKAMGTNLSNIGYCLPNFLMRCLPGTPMEVAAGMIPTLRLKATRHGGVAYLDIDADTVEDAWRRMGLAVSLLSLWDPDEDGSLGITLGHGPAVAGPRVAEAFGGLIDDDAKAGNLVRAATGLLVGRRCDYGERGLARLCLSTLLGSPRGRMALAAGPGDGPLASDVVPIADGRPIRAAWAGDPGPVRGVTPAAMAVLASVKSDIRWGAWATGEVASLVGSVAYANAVIEAVPYACGLLDVGMEWDRPGADAPVDLLAGIDWDEVGDEARRTYAEHEAARQERIARREAHAHDGDDDWDYDDYDDDDYDDDWDYDERDWVWEHSCMFRNMDDDALAGDLEAIADMCELIDALRPALAHLDPMGWGMLLSAYPSMSTALEGDGGVRPLPNGFVATAFGAFCHLVDERLGANGMVDAITLPPVVMGDGSVMRIFAERQPGVESYDCRLACDSLDGDFRMLFADPRGDGGDAWHAGGRDDILDFVFDMCMAPRGGEEAAG